MMILMCVNTLCRVAVKEEALDAPSLARGSKRSLSGVSPPYAAPLSPKHLRTEAHPSEGTAAMLVLSATTVINQGEQENETLHK